MEQNEYVDQCLMCSYTNSLTQIYLFSYSRLGVDVWSKISVNKNYIRQLSSLDATTVEIGAIEHPCHSYTSPKITIFRDIFVF